MNHIDDDTLLQLALELLDESASQAARDHLSVCRECRLRFKWHEGHMSLMSGVSAEISHFSMIPKRLQPSLAALFRIAAILFIGVMAGWGAASVFSPPRVAVYAARMHTQCPADPTARGTACSDATGFYEMPRTARSHNNDSSHI
jgi:hypothetical protein